jgi:hypothetical protein
LADENEITLFISVTYIFAKISLFTANPVYSLVYRQRPRYNLKLACTDLDLNA